MKAKTKYLLNEFFIKFLFSGWMLFIFGFIIGVAYEQSFPGFFSQARAAFLSLF